MKIITKVADKDQANLLLELAGTPLRSNVDEPHFICVNNGVYSVTKHVSKDDHKVSKQFFLFAIETGKLIPDISDEVEFSIDGGTSWATPTDPNFCTQPSYNMLVRKARKAHQFKENDVVVDTKGNTFTMVTPVPDSAGLVVVECNGEYILHEFNTLSPYIPPKSAIDKIMDLIPDDVLNICDLEGQLQWLVDEGKITIHG